MQGFKNFSNYNTVFCALLLVATVLRFAFLDRKAYWADEVVTSVHASGHVLYELVNNQFDNRPLRKPVFEQLLTLDRKVGPNKTVEATAIEDPHVPPLYYLLVRGWMFLFGSSVTAVRSLSALAGALSVFAMWRLARRLLHSEATALLASALFAFSPLFVLYSQEARPYSVYVLLALLSTNCLLAAEQPTNKNLLWLMYVASLALGLYAQPTFLFVMVAHLLYASSRRNSHTAMFKGVVICQAFAALAFAPWFLVMLQHWSTIQSSTMWLYTNVPLGVWSTRFILNFGRLIADVPIPLESWIAIMVVAAQIAALICIRKSERLSVLTYAHLLPPLFLLVAIDSFRGGIHALVPRYFLAGYLFLLLSLAYALGALVIRSKRLGIAVTGSFVALELASSLMMLPAAVWWSKGTAMRFVKDAEVINSTPHPTVLTQAGYGETPDLISLVLLSRRDAIFVVSNKNNRVPVLNKIEPATFVFRSDETYKKLLCDQNKCWLRPLNQAGTLWQVLPMGQSAQPPASEKQ